MRFVEFGTLSRTTISSGSISIPSSSITPSYRESTNEASTSSPFDAAGPKSLRRLDTLPRSGWTGTVLDTPQRCHQRIWYVNDVIKLRGYEGPIRQLAVDGLGREKPTLFLSNHFEETARNVIIRYAGRNRVEDGLGISVNFFHLDCLASEVRLNVDLDATMTVLANGCYRWLGKATARLREG